MEDFDGRLVNLVGEFVFGFVGFNVNVGSGIAKDLASAIDVSATVPCRLRRSSDALIGSIMC